MGGSAYNQRVLVMQTANLSWHDTLRSLPGVQIKSPLSGFILHLSHHPDILYAKSALPFALCLKLSHGEVKAPFNCHFSRRLDGGRRLCFTQGKGLRLQVELPEDIIKHQSRGLHWLANDKQQLMQGQPVLRIDLQQFHQPLIAVIMLEPHPAFIAVHSMQYQVDAATDPCFIINLKQK